MNDPKKKTKKSKKLIGGMDEPPPIHPQMNMINNLTVGEYYDFVLVYPWGERDIFQGRLLPLTNQHVADPSLRIDDYSINGQPQQGMRSFPRSFVQGVYSISSQPLQPPQPPQPRGGGKKMSRKKAKSVRKKSKSLKKNRKTKKTKKN